MKTNLPITNNEQPFPKGKYLVSKTDLKGVITYANETFIELSGFPREELIGKSHNMVRHPEMPPQAFEDLWSTVKSGRPWRGCVKNRCKNGDYYWVDAFVVPVRKNDQTIGYMSVRSEPSRQQVQEAETLYRQLNQSKAPLHKKSGQLSIRAKLAGVMILLAMVMTIIGAVGLRGMGQANDGLLAVYEQRSLPMVELDQVGQLSLRNRLILLDAILNPSQENVAKRLDEYHQNIGKAAQSLSALEKSVSEQDRAMLSKLSNDYANLMKEGFEPAVSALQAGDFQLAGRIAKDVIGPLNRPFADDLAKLQRTQADGAKYEYETAKERFTSARALIVVILLLGLAIAASLGSLLIRSILRAFNTAISHFDHIAQGKLTSEIDISSNDETGQLSCSLATMQVHLKVMLDQIVQASDTIEAHSVNLQAEMRRVVEQSDMQQERTHSVAATMEETSQSVSEVAASASSAADAATSAQGVVSESNIQMSQSMAAAQVVVQAVQDSSHTMMELFQSIHRIGEITQMIREVADQTNLLALNAAIEAARAGEQGRGFAVVADEVRKLAERTSASTVDITETVQAIQACTQRAVTSMDEASIRVNTSTSLMQATQDSLHNITKKSADVNDMAQHIAAAAQEQSVASHDVARNMEAISALVKDNTLAAQSAWTATEGLSHTAHELHKLVGHFELIRK
ncbi:MAG: methyl-accepting chemotaxis protein [Sulfurimicrobium sp.]|nr:methyl-accepting chemotaxis protein [Sulfurimicrobium sp.]MDP2198532.1 methyl-accepting chemotaxis protein [Sulfurimicrobium sp.]MDP3686362.1 methyl-accepting chemotaxis protein [Sulfurimicrobium sp.]